MTINERIKNFRKNVLHLNQRQFAANLGMAQTGVSGIEQNGATVTNRVVKSICLTYNLNENWLRNGIEPMYISSSKFSLDEFVKQHGGSELELEILKSYFELEPDIREKLIKEFIRFRMNASLIEPAAMTVGEAEAAYIKSRSSHVQKTKLSASTSTEEISNDINNKAINQ